MSRTRGTIRPRTDKQGRVAYQAIAWLGRDPQTGKPKFVRKTHHTESEAKRWLTSVYSDLDRGTLVEPSKLTVAAYLAQWLETIDVRVSTGELRPTTRLGYGIVVDRYIVPDIGAVPLQRLTTAELDALYARLLSSGRLQREGGLSARSVRYVHTVLRMALAAAVRKGLVQRNVADVAEPPKAKTAKRDAEQARGAWAVGELARFLAHTHDHRLHPAFRLAAMTGMRRGELLGLRWQDVDLEAGRLTVAQTLVAPRYRLAISEPKTGQSRRTVDLDLETVAVLKEHRKRQAEERLAFGPGWGDHPLADDLVFRSEDGTPVTPALFSQSFDTQTKAAGLPRIRLHDLRHGHAIQLRDAGVPAEVISKRLGHASVAFTIDTYMSASPPSQQDAVTRLAEALGEAPS